MNKLKPSVLLNFIGMLHKFVPSPNNGQFYRKTMNISDILIQKLFFPVTRPTGINI